MISLLQQTAPAAVGTTPPGPVSTYTVPLTEAPADAPPASPVTITYDSTPATDAAAGSDAPIAEDALVVYAGAEFTFGRGARLSVGYSGQMGDGVRDHGARAMLRVPF